MAIFQRTATLDYHGPGQDNWELKLELWTSPRAYDFLAQDLPKEKRKIIEEILSRAFLEAVEILRQDVPKYGRNRTITEDGRCLD